MRTYYYLAQETILNDLRWSKWERSLKKVVVQLLSCVWLFVIPWTAASLDTMLPCPSLSPRVCSNSCPLSQWCHPTTSSIVTPFSSCPQYFPGSGSFPKSQLFASGGQSTRTSASASLLPVNIQSRFPLELTGLISLVSKGLLQHLVWEEVFLPISDCNHLIFPQRFSMGFSWILLQSFEF